jgi:NAD(P)-dependent dehydrogenase (short-subunit alcohol dehydrogenase family)
MEPTLQGKVTLVTGAAGVIGRATTQAFRREGATVVGVDIRADPGGCDLYVEADLTDDDAVRAVFARVDSAYGHLDVLFSNAGVALPGDGSVVETRTELWERTLRVNLTSMFLAAKYAVPLILRGGGGAIVNTASLLGTMGSAEQGVAYAASKGAVLALTTETAVGFAKQGLRVNCVSPGPVETPLFTDGVDQAARARRLVHAPTGRFSLAEEVAEAVVFLASDRASHINGMNLRVDGGMAVAYVTP